LFIQFISPQLEKVTITLSGEKDIIVVACTAAIIAPTLGAASLLTIGAKRRHSTWVKKYTADREQHGECKTFVTGTCNY